LGEKITTGHSCSVFGEKRKARRKGIVVLFWVKGSIESVVVLFWVKRGRPGGRHSCLVLGERIMRERSVRFWVKKRRDLGKERGRVAHQ
jgi:hypothetical protein